MKTIILTASLLAAMSAMGATPTRVMPIKPRLHAPEIPGKERHESEVSRRAKAAAAEQPAGRFDFGDMFPARAIREQGQRKTHRLDNIITSQSGTETARQRFEYYDNGLSRLRVNEYKEGNAWVPVEEYGYEWDEDGYCLSQWGCTSDGMSGMKNEFKYNERKLGIEKLSYYYQDNQWYPQEKGEYTYDDYGNIIEEVVSMYDPDAKTWTPILRNEASWTPEGKQTSFATYNWNGSSWTPSDDKCIYEYDADGHITLWGFYLWDGSEWVYYYRIRQEFQNDNITLQTDEYWNPDVDEWTGCYAWKGTPLYSSRTEFSYDANGRQLTEKTYRVNDLDEGWKLSADCTFTYTPQENGDVRMQREMYLSEVSDKVYDILVKDFNSEGFVTYTHEKQDVFKTGTPIDLFDETYTYLDGKYLSYGISYVYSQDSANAKTAEAREEYDYDDARNVIESRHELGSFMNFGEGELLDFTKVSKFTYAYANGNVRTEKLAYMWNGGDYAPNWGEGIEYNFEVPVENTIIWQDLKTDYTIKKSMQYFGTGAGWTDMTMTYNYSDIVSGISEVADNNKISFGPNPVSDVMYIHTSEPVVTEIYSLSGSLMLRSEGTEINVSGLTPGMYLARINGKTYRVVKK